MMWAGNYWLLCDSKERLVCMVNDLIEELLDLDTEPKPNVVVEEHASGRREKDVECGEEGTRMGPPLQRRVRGLGIPLSTRWGRGLCKGLVS